MKVAIVGAQELTRDNAPWDDETFDIWLMNEWPMMNWCKRWTASIDVHWPTIFKNRKFDRNTDKKEKMDYYEWLKKPHGKPIYMQEAFPEIPDAVKYPLKEINSTLLSNIQYENEPIINFRTSVSYITALAIYLGYEQIDYYGIELQGVEYKGQMSNFNFWTGVAVGKGIKVNLHCSRGSFVAPLYGYQAFIKDSKTDQYYNAMLEQLEEKKREYNMLEGAFQLVKQMLEDQMKEDVDEPE